MRLHGLETLLQSGRNLCDGAAEEGRAAGGFGELFQPIVISLIQTIGALVEIGDK